MDPDICVGGEGPDRRAAGPNPELTGQRDRVERFWIRNQDRYFIRILYIQRVRVETPRVSGEIPMVRIRNPWVNEKVEWFWIRNHNRYLIRILYIQVVKARIETPRVSGEIPLVRIRNPWGNETEWNGSGSEITTVT